MALHPVVQARVTDAVVALLAVVWFALALGGLGVMNPLNIGWMIEGDWFGHLFGWLFARNGPWSVPITLAPDLLYPTGSSAAFTDSIPLMSLVGKVVGLVGPAGFQLFGLYMCLGYVGAGLVGVRVLRHFTTDQMTQVLGALLFIVNPILVARYGHPPFLWHFILVALVWLAIKPIADASQANRVALQTAVLGATAGSINAYMSVMAFALAATIAVRLVVVGVQPLKTRLASLALPLAVPLSMAFFGFFSGMNGPPMRLGAEGFGQFSADLTTLINPNNWSRLWSGLPVNPRQGEGFGYLGLGALLLLGLRLATALKLRQLDRRQLVSLLPFGFMALSMAFYALSDHITVSGRVVLDLSEYYAPFSKLTGMFRSSGRFVWPLHAALVILAVSTVRVFANSAWAARAVVAVAVMAQCGDLKWQQGSFEVAARRQFAPFRAPEWALADQGYRHFNIHPVMVQWICPYDHELVAKVSWEAYLHKMTINSGHVGRVPISVEQSCFTHLPPDQLDAQTIYVPQRDFIQDLLSAGFVCRGLDGYPVCVSPANDTPLLRRFLQMR